jgi:hypothetical protein
MNDILLIEIIAADIVAWLLQRDARKRKQLKG